MRQPSRESGPSTWILTEPNRPPVTVWGLTATERLRREAKAAGVPPSAIGTGPQPQACAGSETCILFRSDYLFDERLVRALVASVNTILCAPPNGLDPGEPVAAHVVSERLPEAVRLLGRDDRSAALASTSGSAPPAASDLRFVEPVGLAGIYTPSLRRADAPYLLRVEPEAVLSLERRIFDASYKGVTDLITKWVWPLPAWWVTRRLARRGVHPNMVTAVSWMLAAVAALLFARGIFGWGLAVAWAMTFLDTVDGKLARVTLTSSRTGGALDHGLDLLHPPFWYAAWALGLPATGVLITPALAVTLVGYAVGRAIEGLFLLAFKTEIHCWRPLDSQFRVITARRNPNLILLTVGACAGRPDAGLVLVATWTVISVGFHTVRLVQAVVTGLRRHRVHAWLDGGAVCKPSRSP